MADEEKSEGKKKGELPRSVAVVVAILTAAAPLTAGIMQAGSAWAAERDSADQSHKQLVDAMLNAPSADARRRLLRYVAMTDHISADTRKWAYKELKIEEKEEAELMAERDQLAEDLAKVRNQTHQVLTSVIGGEGGLEETRKRWAVAQKRLEKEDLDRDELLAMLATAEKELEPTQTALTRLHETLEDSARNEARKVVERQREAAKLVEEGNLHTEPVKGEKAP